MVWQVRGWYCWLYVILCTVTIWFDRCVVGIAGYRLYCVPLLFGLTGAWLVLLIVCYIVYRYYLVWQVRGWYCWLYVILCTVTIWFDRCVVGIAGYRLYCVPLLFGLTGAWMVLLIVCYILYRYYLVWQVRGWYCWLYVILCTVTIWFDRYVDGIADCMLYFVPLLFGLTGARLVLLAVGYIVYRYYLVWQVRGWYCWLYVILCTVTIWFDRYVDGIWLYVIFCTVVWQVRGWYCWLYVILCTVTIWFDRYVDGIADCMLYFVPLLFGLTGARLVLLAVGYIVYRYYLVWQVRGWYCWLHVISCTVTIWFDRCVVGIADCMLYYVPLLFFPVVCYIVYRYYLFLVVCYIVYRYYLVWQVRGWYCWLYVILCTVTIWFDRCVVGIAGCKLYCVPLLFSLTGAWLVLLVVCYIMYRYYFFPVVCYIVYRYFCSWWYAILCTVTIWFDRCKVGIAGCSLYCVPLLFGLTGAWLVLLVVCYIVYRYYVVWQVRGWYCWLYVILCTVTI